MKMMNKIMFLAILLVSIISTTVLAGSVSIASFTVKESTNKNIGSNVYSSTKAYYTADISSVTLASGNDFASYYVQPKTASIGFNFNFAKQTLSASLSYVCIKKTFTSTILMNNTTLNFYVTGNSGTITNSVILS